jgi:hypothetical protein
VNCIVLNLVSLVFYKSLFEKVTPLCSDTKTTEVQFYHLLYPTLPDLVGREGVSKCLILAFW